MSLELYSLHDIDISKGVEADLFISALPQEHRALKISDVQAQLSQLCWYVASGEAQDSGPIQDLPAEQVVKAEELSSKLEAWLSSKQDGISTIFLDVSCMPHSLMTSVARSICLFAESRQISLIVGYVIAEFSPPPQTKTSSLLMSSLRAGLAMPLQQLP